MKECEHCKWPVTEKQAHVSKKFTGFELCEDCETSYDNKTGHCSLDCCISGKCDESC